MPGLTGWLLRNQQHAGASRPGCFKQRATASAEAARRDDAGVVQNGAASCGRCCCCCCLLSAAAGCMLLLLLLLLLCWLLLQTLDVGAAAVALNQHSNNHQQLVCGCPMIVERRAAPLEILSRSLSTDGSQPATAPAAKQHPSHPA